MAELQTEDKQAEAFEWNNDPSFVSASYMVSFKSKRFVDPWRGFALAQQTFQTKGIKVEHEVWQKLQGSRHCCSAHYRFYITSTFCEKVWWKHGQFACQSSHHFIKHHATLTPFYSDNQGGLGFRCVLLCFHWMAFDIVGRSKSNEKRKES